ncbi:MAG TPA: plastocyanin/azurin family copper-binding protein [Gemmatimonadaceae bacterium]|nr:plastocyanin/azurin family copper-binding protein [Gemmatimonadaceae bacterium]
MRFIGPALLASAFVLGACSGGEQAQSTDSTAAAPAAATTPAASGVAAAPITGTTHVVKMEYDGSAYRFDPAEITIKQGDAIRFESVSGGPHNVGFNPDSIPDDVEAQLAANMPEPGGAMTKTMGPLESPFLNDSTNYTISFGNIKPGTYPFHCSPHLAMGMVGKVTVQ